MEQTSTQGQSSRRPLRNDGIDILRGVSIVLVIMHHLAIRIPLAHTQAADLLPGWFLAGLCWNGSESVVVFFVISGFLITGNAMRRWPSLGAPRFADFYLRRASRILPCLLALLVVLGVLDAAGAPDYVIDRPDQSLAGAVFAALTFHLNWYEAFSDYLPGNWDVLWSLSVEEVFYLGFPIACLTARRSNHAFLAFLITLALSLPLTHGAIHGNELLREKAYLPGMAAIATGVLAAILEGKLRLQRAWCIAPIVVGTVLCLAIMFAEDVLWRRLGEATMLLLTIGAALLLIGLARRPARAPRMFGWLSAFGRLSYEVYLTHMFVVFTALRLFRESGATERAGWCLYPLVLAVSLALARIVSVWLAMPAELALRLSL